MPAFNFTQALTANQRGFDPLSTWQYKRVPFVGRWAAGAVVSVMINATTTGAESQIVSGTQTIQQRAPVQAGGTAGVMPNPLNQVPVVWQAAPGDQINISIDETAGGTPTVNGIIVIEPAA